MEQYIGRFLDDRYEILDILGTGGMAVVYKAKDHRLNRMVAIKILKEELAGDQEIRNRFHDESQAVAQLNNSNIVNVFDVNQSDDVEYIVMELIEGITLKQYMRKRGTSLNWREALHFTVQILQALRHAHSRGIIHRDIKPQNIMVLRDGSVKVADFGIARINGSQRTMTQEALGSVHYISPEQAKGSVIDARSDLYSAGVVLYEMLTGTLPYTGDSPVAVALQHVNSVPKPPRLINPDIPLGMEQITKRAMAPNKDLRYDDADAMLADLDAFRKNPSIDFGYSDPWVLEGKIREDEPTQIHSAALIPPDEPEAIPEPEPELPEEPEEVLESEETDLPEDEEYPEEPEYDEGYDDEYEEGFDEAYDEEYLEDIASEDDGGRHKGAIAGVIVGVVVLAGLVVFAIFRLISTGVIGNRTTYMVPELTGRTYSEAVGLIANDEDLKGHFTIRVSEEKAYDGAYEPGEIINQDPKGGTKTTSEETEITVTLCAEKEEEAEIKYMPDIVGENYQSWVQTLNEDYDVVVKFRNQFSDDYEKNVIISTDPKAGAELKEKQTVLLYISKGPKAETVTMISLVGMTETQALRAIREMKLEPGSINRVDSDEPEDRVVFQSIKQGAEVEVGTQVNIQISKGPQTTQNQNDKESQKGDTDQNNTDDNNDNNDSDNNQNQQEETTPSAQTSDEENKDEVEDQTNHQIKVTLPEDRETDSALVIRVNGNIIYSSSVGPEDRVRTVDYTGSIDSVEVTVDGTSYDGYAIS